VYLPRENFLTLPCTAAAAAEHVFRETIALSFALQFTRIRVHNASRELLFGRSYLTDDAALRFNAKNNNKRFFFRASYENGSAIGSGAVDDVLIQRFRGYYFQFEINTVCMSKVLSRFELPNTTLDHVRNGYVNNFTGVFAISR